MKEDIGSEPTFIWHQLHEKQTYHHCHEHEQVVFWLVGAQCDPKKILFRERTFTSEKINFKKQGNAENWNGYGCKERLLQKVLMVYNRKEGKSLWQKKENLQY